MEQLHDIIKAANGWLWGPPLLILLFGTHLYITVRTGFIQRFIPLAIKLSFTRDGSGKGDVSHFAALSTALAATIGTGNIVGVATAIAVGGPGAVFWMWLTGVFGIATKYGEALLAVKYRVITEDGTMLGGPMYALERGLNMKWLGVLFAIFTAIAAFGIGNMVQANSISQLLEKEYAFNPMLIGLVLSFITAVVILGGIRSIARVCEMLVPFMTLFYIGATVTILWINMAYILPALELIGVSAFSPQAAAGGFIGTTVLMTARAGISRGLFSNESGLGSAPIVAAAAQTRNPVRQALVSSTGTFWDTVVVCALTGLVVVTSILRNPEGAKGLDGSALTGFAFDTLPVIGSTLLVISLLTFVFSTILGWSYYGERAVEYLGGKKLIRAYRILWVVAVYVGATATLKFVWDFSDMANALMAIPNLLALLLLSGVIVRETKKYIHQIDSDATEE